MRRTPSANARITVGCVIAPIHMPAIELSLLPGSMHRPASPPSKHKRQSLKCSTRSETPVPSARRNRTGGPAAGAAEGSDVRHRALAVTYPNCPPNGGAAPAAARCRSPCRGSWHRWPGRSCRRLCRPSCQHWASCRSSANSKKKAGATGRRTGRNCAGEEGTLRHGIELGEEFVPWGASITAGRTVGSERNWGQPRCGEASDWP